MKHFALLLMFTLPTACSPPDDIFEAKEAFTVTTNNPWGDVAVDLWTGTVVSGPGMTVGHGGALYRKRDGSNGCWWIDFGLAPLSNTYDISASSSADRAWTAATGGTGISCSFGNVVLDPPDAFHTNLWMAGGDDECHAGSTKRSAEYNTCHGQDGNDKLYISYSGWTLTGGYGEAGNDSIVDLTGNSILSGGDGSDCITWVSGHVPSTADGGPGTDTAPVGNSMWITNMEVIGSYYTPGAGICNLQ
jgi:hypothetical protein